MLWLCRVMGKIGKVLAISYTLAISLMVTHTHITSILQYCNTVGRCVGEESERMVTLKKG